MNITRTLALAVAIAAPALASATASAPSFSVIDFEQDWAYGSTVGTTYAASQGVVFSDAVGGLSNNDGLGGNPDGSYYANAPSPLGVMFAYADGPATMDVAAGVSGTLYFAFASTDVAVGAVKAYDGLGGTGNLLGSFDLSATGSYNAWTTAAFSFAGTAKSFDFSSSAGLAAFDNISAVPEPASVAMMLAGAMLVLSLGRRRRNEG